MPKDPIKIQRFEELSDGDPQSLAELIDLYVTKTTEQIMELENAVDRNSSSDVARIAHSMVGASLMVGLDSLVPLLRDLENYGEKADMAKGRPVFAELQKEFKVIHAALIDVGKGLQAIKS